MASVSILGDSISTFKDYNPVGYEVFYDWYTQKKNGLKGMEDTWWGRVMKEYGLTLCVNDSFSGSKVTGNSFPAAFCEERLNNLHKDGLYPDYILVYIGFNDFGYGEPIRTYKKSDDVDLRLFEGAYDYMVKRLSEVYKGSKIICGTLMRTKLHGRTLWQFPESFGDFSFNEYNQVIRKACRDHGVYLADLEALDARYDTLDGTHPTAEGHKTIADAWISCVSEIVW